MIIFHCTHASLTRCTYHIQHVTLSYPSQTHDRDAFGMIRRLAINGHYVLRAHIQIFRVPSPLLICAWKPSKQRNARVFKLTTSVQASLLYKKKERTVAMCQCATPMLQATKSLVRQIRCYNFTSTQPKDCLNLQSN